MNLRLDQFLKRMGMSGDEIFKLQATVANIVLAIMTLVCFVGISFVSYTVGWWLICLEIVMMGLAFLFMQDSSNRS
jgi:general stress protein CsbA